MSFIELYSKDILDLTNLGYTTDDFDESRGDYIKVEIFKENSTEIVNTLYSNRLLFNTVGDSILMSSNKSIILESNEDLGIKSLNRNVNILPLINQQ